MKKILFLPIICFIIIFSNQSFSQTELLDTENLLKQLREAMCPKADAECEAAQLKFDEFKKLITDVAEEERVSNTEPILENMDIEKIIIGRVLRVNKGKGFAGDEKLKKRNPVKTGTVFSTLAGGTMTLMLDEKTRIFIGDESEIMIKEFLISEPKSHKVTIELNKGSFSYKSLRKTTTDLEVQLKPDVNKELPWWTKKALEEATCTDCPAYITRLMACAGNPFNSYLWCQEELDRLLPLLWFPMNSFGTDTNVGFSLTELDDDYAFRFVNAGKSNLKIQDEILGLGDYGVINNINEVASTANGTPADFVGHTNFNNINNENICIHKIQIYFENYSIGKPYYTENNGCSNLLYPSISRYTAP